MKKNHLDIREDEVVWRITILKIVALSFGFGSNVALRLSLKIEAFKKVFFLTNLQNQYYES